MNFIERVIHLKLPLERRFTNVDLTTTFQNNLDVLTYLHAMFILTLYEIHKIYFPRNCPLE